MLTQEAAGQVLELMKKSFVLMIIAITLVSAIGIQSKQLCLARNGFCPSYKNLSFLNRHVQQTDDSAIVNKIMDKIFGFPEVKRKQAFVDSLSHHKRGVFMMVMQKPGKVNKYYWIAVGYNGTQRFETYFNFYVWPSQMVIKYLDNETGNLITLAQWRKMQNKN